MPSFLRVVALLLAAAVARAADPMPSVLGLWIHHDKWVLDGPADKDGDIHKVASAAVVNFCPRGIFRMATGVIYQSTRSPEVVIGASDGLAIYSGRWSAVGDTIRVEYHLADAEIPRVPDDLKNPETRVAELTFAKGRLHFPFITRSATVWQMSLLPSERYEKKVDPDFAECPPKLH